LSGRIYSISIIDYLQEFNFNKFMELQLKKIFKGGGDISSVDSEYYFFRFMNFVKTIIVPVTNLKKYNPNKTSLKKLSRVIIQSWKNKKQKLSTKSNSGISGKMSTSRRNDK